MTENHEDGHGSENRLPTDAENARFENGQEIIELSDIAIGITPEDDAIVELTEELIGEAFVGFAGATSEVIHDDERRIDLSEAFSGIDGSADDMYDNTVFESPAPDDISGAVDLEDDNLEADINQELDNYFGTDEDVPVAEETILIDPSGPMDETLDETEEQSGTQTIDEKTLQMDEIRISPRQLDDAMERIIRKMFAEKINRILEEVIEKTVSEEISLLKDYLLGLSGKNK